MNVEYSFGLSCIIILTIVPVCWPTKMQIIRPRELSEGVKSHAEFELSLFTESLGFVDDEHQQAGTPWENILKQYIEYTHTGTARLAFDTKITKEYFGRDTQARGHLCQAYLSADVFEYNRIHYQFGSNEHPYRYELKQVRLHYFSQTREQLVKVVGCPIRLGHEVEIARLYFQEIHFYHHSTPSSLGRGYFVFANMNVPQDSIQSLELLVFLTNTEDRLPAISTERGEEPDVYDALQRRRYFAPRLLLRAPVRLGPVYKPQPLYIFGREAELHFLTKTYGFIDIENSEWSPGRFISILDRMKKGYEVDRIKMNIVRDDTNTETACFNYINHNSQLGENRVFSRVDLISGRINWITKSVKFRETKILSSRDYELLQCPIDEFKERHYLYILPVHYLNPDKAPQVFTFLEPKIIAGRADPNKVLPFILSEATDGQMESERTESVLPTAMTDEDTIYSTRIF